MKQRKQDMARMGKNRLRLKTKARRVLLFFLLWILVVLQPSAFSQPLAEGEGYITADDGVRLFYKIVGSGLETLVVIHGGPGNSMNSLLPDMEPLAQDRTVIYYDQRGNGRSDLLKNEEQLTIARHVADLEIVRRHFNLEKMNLLGNSWGGLLAGFYAIAHPEHVARMVLHSPASPSFELLRESTPYIYQRIPEDLKSRFMTISNPDRWVNSLDPHKLCREFYDILKPVYFSDLSKADAMKGDTCARPLEAIRLQLLVNKQIWVSLGEWDLQPALREIRVPTLVIHGRDDMIPLDSSLAWTAAMPEARLLIIDSGHMTHIEQPEVFFPAVAKFLTGAWPDNAEIVRDRLPQIPGPSGFAAQKTSGHIPFTPPGP
ncbi:MAG: alpha/beta fold hydrolase [Desulfobulbaceae bacterium]